jgi:PAS domain S-box-containing protein
VAEKPTYEELEQRVQVLEQAESERRKAEASLKKERDKAQQYLDIAGVIFLAIDANQHVTMINKKGCDVLDYAENEIVGKNWFDHFIKAENIDEIKGVFNRIISGKIEPVEYYENAILTKGGDEKIIAWHNAIIKNESGHISGTLSSGEDITERKKAEKALSRAKEQLEENVKERTAEIQEKSIALKVLLEQRGNDKKKLEESIMSNVKELLIPNVKRLKNNTLSSKQKTTLNVLESNLNEIISPFTTIVSSIYMKLTPTEIQVANFIKHGATSKDIAESLSLSQKTVDSHRYNIRKKLGIGGKDINLRTYLSSVT